MFNNFVEVSSFFADLPAHHYGVHVENEMDARRLLYLVEQIGADKVINSAYKYSQKYPGSRIFVSTLLKRYRVHVPTRVFAPVNVPVYRVYVLVHSASRKLKIGVSGNWLRRVMRFSHDYSLAGFDLDQSVGINFRGDKKTALAAEKMAKKIFSYASTTPPECVPYGAYGHKEWFDAEIYKGAVSSIASFHAMSSNRDYMTLHDAFTFDIRDEAMDSYFSNCNKGINRYL
jgi:hypothetical protein